MVAGWLRTGEVAVIMGKLLYATPTRVELSTTKSGLSSISAKLRGVTATVDMRTVKKKLRGVLETMAAVETFAMRSSNFQPCRAGS